MYPQVVLFGSVGGGWREAHIIPMLEELGVTYFNPVQQDGWTAEDGAREADYMAHAETIIMVINNTTPAYTALAESGWAALGARERGQTLVLYVMQDTFHAAPPWWLRWVPWVRETAASTEHYAASLRKLMQEHARAFELDSLHVVDSMEGVIKALRARYGQ